MSRHSQFPRLGLSRDRDLRTEEDVDELSAWVILNLWPVSSGGAEMLDDFGVGADGWEPCGLPLTLDNAGWDCLLTGVLDIDAVVLGLVITDAPILMVGSVLLAMSFFSGFVITAVIKGKKYPI